MTMDWAGWMRLAVKEAGRGTGETGPNPLVGALVVRDGACVGRGYHQRVGEAHAEVHALNDAGGRAVGADLVVTLEPCAHTGRTGPCTERILASGVKRVFVGTLDPNPRERGAGVRRLREAGVEVTVGWEEARCRRQNEAYFKFITTGLPFVTVKLGASLDGRLGPENGRHEAVTGRVFQRFVHGLRRDNCAVMIGGRTLAVDDPELSVRLARPVTHPWRVVVLGRQVPPATSRLLSMGPGERTAVFSAELGHLGQGAAEVRERLVAGGGRWYEVGCGEDGRLELPAVIRTLGELGVSRLLVEGGGVLAGGLAQAGLVDRWVVAHAPCLIGQQGTPLVELPGIRGMDQAIRLRLERTAKMGEDLVGFYRSGPDYTQVIGSGENP